MATQIDKREYIQIFGCFFYNGTLRSYSNPVPIRRKGCKNAGWILKNGNKVVVKLNPNKPLTYITERYPL